jgi:hypothetical protein
MSTRHSWTATPDPARPGGTEPDQDRLSDKTCGREGCGVRARRYGRGRNSYWGYLYPGEAQEVFPPRVPLCGTIPPEVAMLHQDPQAAVQGGLAWIERIGQNPL